MRRGGSPPIVPARCFCEAFGAGERMSRGRYTSRGTAAVRAGTLERERDPQTFGSRSERELNLFSSKPVFLLPATSP